MQDLTLEDIYDYFRKHPTSSLWVPTQVRNGIIAGEGFSSTPKITVKGRVYRWHFRNIGGGMWEISLRNLDGGELV